MRAPADGHEAPAPRTARELADRLAAERTGTAFLLFRNAEDAQRIVALEPQRLHYTLGRDPATDIALGWDQEVSRVHAELEYVAGQWVIVDEGLSRNGTYVNGYITRGRRRLRDGDCVRVGRSVLVFASGTAATAMGVTVSAGGSPLVEELTPMQRRILAALCRPLAAAGGLAPPASNREIADAVHLSVEGVKSQLRTLCERFEIGDLPQTRKRLELAERAYRAGLGAPAHD
jgi:pSer/pThr/pTyr-binding forkhead associated (FHA) protein